MFELCIVNEAATAVATAARTTAAATPLMGHGRDLNVGGAGGQNTK